MYTKGRKFQIARVEILLWRVLAAFYAFWGFQHLMIFFLLFIQMDSHIRAAGQKIELNRMITIWELTRLSETKRAKWAKCFQNPLIGLPAL